MKHTADHAAPTLSRRTFVAAAAATGAAAAAGLTGCSPKTENEKPQGTDGSALEDPFADCQTVYGCCPPECQHHLLKGYVRDGKLLKVESAEVNESPACVRGFARVEMCNSDLRLTKPLKLVGEKGSGEFEEISWDEAYELMQEKIQDALDNGGDKGIAWFVCSGNFSSLTMDLPGAFFSWLGGGTTIVGNECCAGIDSGLAPIFGTRSKPTRNEIPHSRYIIAWGNNPAVTMTGYFDRFQEMIEKGGTLCTIDPFYSETADKSQEWMQPWPGSDSALALGMLKVVIGEKLYDEEYLLAHTTAPCLIDKASNTPYFADVSDDTTYQVYDSVSKKIVPHDQSGIKAVLSVEEFDIGKQYVTIFDLIKAEADKWDKEAVEAETGCSYEDVARIARDYANAESAMIIQNMGGFQRTENGTYATATQVYLALFCGHVGHKGDGVYDVGGASSFVDVGSAFESNPDATVGVIPLPVFGDFIAKDEPNPIKCLFFFGSEYVAQKPNNNTVKAALKKIPFVVTSDMFMTSTCLYSDLVLPCTAVFESPNVTASARSSVIQISEAGVTPPGEAQSDLKTFSVLAEKLGFGDKFNEDPSVYIKRVLAPTGVTYEELLEKKGVNVWPEGWIPYEGGIFDTPTGKAHLWVQQWVDEGFPGIACHQRPVEHPLNTDGMAAKYPLASVQRKTRHEVHTTFANLETMQALDGHKPKITIHPDDAKARDIKDGDAVVAYNDRGEHGGIAYVTDHVKKGVVVLENGWSDVNGGSSSSSVTSNAWPTLGTIHCCNSTLIEVKKGA